MKYISGITLSIFLLFSCSSNTDSGSQTDTATPPTEVQTKVVHMTAQEFQTKIVELGNPQIVDVRTSSELASSGYIQNSRNMDINGSEFGDQVATLNKDQAVLVYCAAGGRSKKACNSMKDWGFKEIYELDSGFGGWQSAGLPVTKQ